MATDLQRARASRVSTGWRNCQPRRACELMQGAVGQVPGQEWLRTRDR